MSVQGYIWGHNVAPLLEAIDPEPVDPAMSSTGTGGFDLIILSDLVFNHAAVSNPATSSYA